MPTISHGKLSIHYLEWGNPGDPVIILVHGVLLSSPMFEPLATRLKGWRVIGVDVRGHGGSSRPRQSRCYSWRLFASDVRALMDELGIEKAVIGGVSLGANVALEFAHLFPARVRALVIEMPVLSASEGPARYTFVSAGKALRRFGRFLGCPRGLYESWLRRLAIRSWWCCATPFQWICWQRRRSLTVSINRLFHCTTPRFWRQSTCRRW
ncbi:MAG: alpha/beta fold hydrolase [Rhodocyclaceae bacterium]|nr:alpha/beta fold hydrolase [Rhodocyclaceae bacterium]